MKKTKILLVSILTLTLISFISCDELLGLEDEEETAIDSISCTGYVGPSNIDRQYDFQCQAAYAYKCNGDAEALRQQCAYYKQLQQELNLPDCDYCD
jgi:hypothetical protein